MSALSVIRRFLHSSDNFKRVYRPLADAWAIYENSDREPQWREGLESKEKTCSAKFCCRSWPGAAQGREGCGKDRADARDAFVPVAKRPRRLEETLRRGSV